jgi:hypothetical protein
VDADRIDARDEKLGVEQECQHGLSVNFRCSYRYFFFFCFTQNTETQPWILITRGRVLLAPDSRYVNCHGIIFPK